MRSVVAQLSWLPLVGLGLVACSGTGDGGGGDPLSIPAANPYGNGSRISELIGYAEWEDLADGDSALCSDPNSPPPPPPPPDRLVAVDGVMVSTVDRFDETGDGAVGNIYVQDALLHSVEPGSPEPAIPYSGVTVYDPSFSPPDLRVVPGDVVDVFGLLQEFAGPTTGFFSYCRTLPEIGGTMSFRFESSEPMQPEPVTIPVSELASYQGMRKWLGVLVKVENVELGDDPYDPPSGRYSVRINVGGGVQLQDVPTITNELFDLKNAGLNLVQGATFSSVTGVVTYFYGTHLSPRSIDDIVP